MTEPVKNRLIDIAPDAMTSADHDLHQRLTQGRGRIPQPFRVWQHCPKIADGMEVIGTHLDNASVFSPPEAEIIILSVAAYWRSPYVVTNHVRHSRTAGLSEEAIETICAGGKPHFDDARHQLLADVVWAALEKRDLGDATFATFEKAFGRRGIAELLAAIGYFTAVSIAMRFHAMRPTSKSVITPPVKAGLETRK